jgi:hypothetical protein
MSVNEANKTKQGINKPVRSRLKNIFNKFNKLDNDKLNLGINKINPSVATMPKRTFLTLMLIGAMLLLPNIMNGKLNAEKVREKLEIKTVTISDEEALKIREEIMQLIIDDRIEKINEGDIVDMKFSKSENFDNKYLYYSTLKKAVIYMRLNEENMFRSSEISVRDMLLFLEVRNSNILDKCKDEYDKGNLKKAKEFLDEAKVVGSAIVKLRNISEIQEQQLGDDTILILN